MALPPKPSPLKDNQERSMPSEIGSKKRSGNTPENDRPSKLAKASENPCSKRDEPVNHAHTEVTAPSGPGYPRNVSRDPRLVQRQKALNEIQNASLPAEPEKTMCNAIKESLISTTNGAVAEIAKTQAQGAVAKADAQANEMAQYYHKFPTYKESADRERRLATKRLNGAVAEAEKQQVIQDKIVNQLFETHKQLTKQIVQTSLQNERLHAQKLLADADERMHQCAEKAMLEIKKEAKEKLNVEVLQFKQVTNSLDSKVNDLRKEMQSMAKALDNVRKENFALKEHSKMRECDHSKVINELQTENASLRSSASNTQTHFDALAEKVDSLETQLAQHSKPRDCNQSNLVNELQTEVSSLRQSTCDRWTQLAVLSDKMESMHIQLALQSPASDTQAHIASLSDKVKLLESQLALQSPASDAQTSLASLNDKVKSLETQFAQHSCKPNERPDTMSAGRQPEARAITPQSDRSSLSGDTATGHVRPSKFASAHDTSPVPEHVSALSRSMSGDAVANAQQVGQLTDHQALPNIERAVKMRAAKILLKADTQANTSTTGCTQEEFAKVVLKLWNLSDNLDALNTKVARLSTHDISAYMMGPSGVSHTTCEQQIVHLHCALQAIAPQLFRQPQPPAMPQAVNSRVTAHVPGTPQVAAHMATQQRAQSNPRFQQAQSPQHKIDSMNLGSRKTSV